MGCMCDALAACPICVAHARLVPCSQVEGEDDVEYQSGAEADDEDGEEDGEEGGEEGEP